MAHFQITKGLDLKIAGSPDKELEGAPPPETIAIHPIEFSGIKPKVLVKEGDEVSGGTPLFHDKKNPNVQFVSPVSGKITGVRLGRRRAVLAVTIGPDGRGNAIDFGTKTVQAIRAMSREEAVKYLENSGTFVFLRGRPFDRIPLASRAPKSIFINGMNTAPGALDQGVVLKDKAEELGLGIEILKKLTEGSVHLCYASSGNTDVFKGLEGAALHTFSGPHPAGLVGTHIHFVDPINKGDIVWHLNAIDLAAIGSLLKTGRVATEKFIAVSGVGVKNRKYFQTLPGASLASLLKDNLNEGDQRIINGTILYGTTLEESGHILFYPNDLQVIPEGRKRRFLGWAMPGKDQYSASSRAFASAFFPEKERAFHTNANGGYRAIVWTDVYDEVMPLDIYTNFLYKAVLAQDIEEAENLGILEVAEEDFALATYLCPSKNDVSAVIGQGLKMIEAEGY